MTTTTQSGFWAWFARPEAQSKTGPEIKPRPGPVFIHDAIVPWQDGTLLLDILRKDIEREDDQG